MENRRNYYRILQVQPDAPVEVIKASYRALMRELRLHPDLGSVLTTGAGGKRVHSGFNRPARASASRRASTSEIVSVIAVLQRPV